jgi:hypothetical protein
MSKDVYRELCRKEDCIPVFSRDWWLDAACGDDWTALVKEKNGRIQAAMPLYTPCRWVVSMPHYTQTMGVWFAAEADDMKYASRLRHRQVICACFIEKLKPYKSFFQNFDCGFTDWLPFYWEGYAQTTRYTYILYDIKDFDKRLGAMNRQTRRNIKVAEDRSIEVHRGISADDFLQMQELTFERQRLRNKQSRAVLLRLIEAAHARGQGDLFGGYDADGNLHAAAFVVWQKSSAYYIAGGSDPLRRTSGAHTLVLWDAIRYVSQYTDAFDFEGSMLPGVERSFREFGGVQTPYFQISKGKPSLMDRVLRKLKNR